MRIWRKTGHWLPCTAVSVLALTGEVVPVQVQEPAAAPANEILRVMDGYMGHWRSEDKTDPRGNTFHFELDLAWMDPDRTIARLHITRVGPDGATSTVFEGFKGREPSGTGVYYFAASPSGRASRGEVRLEGNDFVTAYEGWTSDGRVVGIRDVFAPVENGAYVSRTFLRRTPDGEWRQVGQDQWRRVEPRSAPDPSRPEMRRQQEMDGGVVVLGAVGLDRPSSEA